MSHQEVGEAAQAKHGAVGLELEANIPDTMHTQPLMGLVLPRLCTVLWLLPS